MMTALALMFLGMISWRELAVQRLPDITLPYLAFSARVEEGDLSPEQTNDNVTRPLEKIVASLPGIREMNTYTGNGFCWGYSAFERGTDIRFRVIDLQDKVNKWIAEQPLKVNANIMPYTTGDESLRLMDLILSVPIGQEFRTAFCGDIIRRGLRSIDGISGVDIAGESQANITLIAERDELLGLGMDASRLTGAINAANRGKLWLGSIREGNRTRPIHSESRINSLEDVLAVPLDAGGIFAVGDLVRVDPNEIEEKSIYRFNGKKAVRVSITKEKDRNTIQMARKVRERVREINSDLPDGFQLTITNDEARDLEDLISKIARLAVMGALLSLFVLLVFVRNPRVALVVVTAIPVSLFVTFNAMYAANLSINILSLLGLAAGVGMLVDNSIVVLENIFRHFQRGAHADVASWNGAREVIRALVVSTATNLVVFIPLFFMDENAAIILKEMALSLIFPMLISLFVAMTLVPMLTSRVIAGLRRTGEKGAPKSLVRSRLKSFFPRLNPWNRPGRPPRRLFAELVFMGTKACLRHPIRLIWMLIILMFITLLASRIKVVVQGMSASSINTVTLYGRAPLQSTLEQTDQMFRKKEEQVREIVNQSRFFESFSTSFDSEGGQIDLHLKPEFRSKQYYHFHEVLSGLGEGDNNAGFRLYSPFPGRARESGGASHINRILRSGGGSYPESIVLTGENMDALIEASTAVEEHLKSVKEVEKYEVRLQKGDPEVHFFPDLELMRVMKADLSSLRTHFESRGLMGIPTNVKIESGDVERLVNLRVLSGEEEQDAGREKDEQNLRTLGDMRRSMVALQGGGQIPLERLGAFSITQGVPYITKKNRQRDLKVGFVFKPVLYKDAMALERRKVLKTIQKSLGDIRLPVGISATVAGALEEDRELRVTWRRLLLLAILAVYLVMAFFFESISAPVIILFTLPLACIGGIWGVILSNSRLDNIAMLGSIILAGLAVNNGILLIEYTRQMERGKNYSRSRAILNSVRFRLRPILMTSLTTILGLAPILYSREAAQEARSLVAIIIGGMIFSAFLTLVVVPTFYNVIFRGMDRSRAFLAGMKRRLLHSHKNSPDLKPGAAVIRRSIPPAPLPPVADELESESLHISIRNVTCVYPNFRMKKILHLLPSRDYPWGHRPPDGNYALHNVDLEIGVGMFGLLGPNGAGKTTLMKILTGLIPPTYGVVEIAGYDLRNYFRDIRRHITYLPQNFGVYETLTLDQYLNFFAPLCGLHDREQRRRRINEVVEIAGLEDVRDKPMKRYSGGMRQRAGIAHIMLNPRPIIIVDEPTAGLDPVERVRFRLTLSELARTRIVILSTHIVDDITSSCRQVAVLNHGDVLYQGGLDGIMSGAQGLIWDVTRPPGVDFGVPGNRILYRKHLGDHVLCHYVATAGPVEGSTPVTPTFEDAYVALLMRHDQHLDVPSPAPLGEMLSQV